MNVVAACDKKSNMAKLTVVNQQYQLIEVINKGIIVKC